MLEQNKGSILAHLMMLLGVLFILLLFVAIILYQYVLTNIFHETKNNLYMVNRNVLIALNREQMGLDENSFYQSKVESLVEKEIERLWGIKVGKEERSGIIRKLCIEDVRIRYEDKKMYICSEIEVSLNPFIFCDALKDKLKFKVIEETKIEKMKG